MNLEETTMPMSYEYETLKNELLKILDSLRWHEVLYHTDKDTSREPESLSTINAMDSKSWECIDGRYSKDVIALRYPGGAAGLFLTIASTLDKSGIDFKILDLLNIFERIMGPLRYHSDNEHSTDKLVYNGCKHLHLEHEESEKYNVHREWMDEIFAKRKLDEDALNGRAMILEGEHNEKAMLVYNKDPDKTQLPSSTFGDGLQFFIYHEAVARKTMKEILEAVVKEWGLFNNLDEINAQLGQTMKEHVTLTAEGLDANLPMLNIESVLEA